MLIKKEKKMKLLKFFYSKPFFEKNEPIGFWEDLFFSHELDEDTNKFVRKGLRPDALYLSALIGFLLIFTIEIWL